MDGDTTSLIRQISVVHSQWKTVQEVEILKELDEERKQQEKDHKI